MSREDPPDASQQAAGRFLWAVGVYGAFHALTALTIAAPVAAALGRVTGRYPRGDAELFDRGGVMLLEALRRVGEQGSVLGAAVPIEAGIAWILGFFVLSIAVALVAEPGTGTEGRGPIGAFAAALRATPALALLMLLATLAEALIVGVFGGTGFALLSALKGRGSAAIWIGIGAGVLTFAAWVVASVAHDIARVAVLARGVGPIAAIRVALTAVRRAGLRFTGAYLWRVAVGLIALILAFWWAPRLRANAGTAFPALFVHQLALAIVAWMRISWLAAAARRLPSVVP